MKKIPLTNSSDFAIVDNEDFNVLSKINWSITRDGYAQAAINGKTTHMHRLLIKVPIGFDTDHINRVKLDNRKDNLRICTRMENSANQSKRSDNTSGFKGVDFDNRKNQKLNKRWRASIKKARKTFYLGRFFTKEEAAIAYNQAAKEYFGEFAALNKV